MCFLRKRGKSLDYQGYSMYLKQIFYNDESNSVYPVGAQVGVRVPGFPAKRKRIFFLVWTTACERYHADCNAMMFSFVVQTYTRRHLLQRTMDRLFTQMC